MRGIVNQGGGGIGVSSGFELDRLFGVTNGVYDKYYELNLITLAEIASAGVPGTMDGIGGMHNRLFTINGSTLYELNPDTFATINSGGTSGWTYPSQSGVGGTFDRMFAGGSQLDYYEFDPDTFAEIDRGYLGSWDPDGVGGTKTRVFVLHGNSYVYDKSGGIMNSVDMNDGNDVGGISERLFVADGSSDDFRERNPYTLAFIGTFDAPGSDDPDGVGGMKGRGDYMEIDALVNGATDFDVVYYNEKPYVKFEEV